MDLESFDAIVDLGNSLERIANAAERIAAALEAPATADPHEDPADVLKDRVW